MDPHAVLLVDAGELNYGDGEGFGAVEEAVYLALLRMCDVESWERSHRFRAYPEGLSSDSHRRGQLPFYVSRAVNRVLSDVRHLWVVLSGHVVRPLVQTLFTKVTSQRRYMHVAEQIIRGVSTGEIAPGTRLPSDRELAELMGVSRPTVREALMALQFLGIVDVRAGNGAFVVEGAKSGFGPGIALPGDAPLEPGEVIEARMAIEPAVARIAADQISPEQVAELETFVDRTELVAQDDDRLDEFIQLGLGFHNELAQVIRNRYLISMCASLVDVVEHPLWALLNRHAMRSREDRLVQVAEHRSVLDLIRRGDANGAAEEMEAHLQLLKETVGGGTHG